MTAYTSEIPPKVGEATHARQRLETTVDHIERATPRMGENEGRRNTFPLRDSRGARLQMGKVEQDSPKMDRDPCYCRGEARDGKSRSFEEAKGAPEIAERCVTLKLQLVLAIAMKLLERGSIALKHP